MSFRLDRLNFLANRYARYGGIPRLLLQQLRREGFEEWERRQRIHDNEIAGNTVRFLRTDRHLVSGILSQGLVTYHEVESSIIRIRPINAPVSPTYVSGKAKPSTECRREIATPYIARIIADGILQRGNTEVRSFFGTLMFDSLLHSAAGVVFERMMHQRIRAGLDIKCNLKITGGQLPGSLHTVKAESWEDFDKLESLDWQIAPKQQGIKPLYFRRYLWRRLANLATIDSLLIAQDRGKPQVLLFQITVGQEHDIKTSGLEALDSEIPTAANKNKWRLIFVTPAANTGLRKEQNIVSADKNEVTKWTNRIEQCVWRVRPEDMWLR